MVILKTIRMPRIPVCLVLCLAVAVVCAGAGLPASALGGTDPDLKELSRRRAERRHEMRAINLAKTGSGEPASFGLLVIPVDFADKRLDAAWQATSLSPRLTSPEGESLQHYFAVASVGKLDLRITLAPLVNLSGSRRDYSDIGLNGFTRTRKLATEALASVRDLGLEFRRLDIDGPDGIAGTADDDGEIDGVLILHAGIGQENDPDDGLIQPLQFFLDEPVVSDGVAAVSYAVASMASGPGIWAHETAHLLGLEDRYDPLLSASGSEVQSRGGLGRFSLMASGAWGRGGGYGAALPDAYSAQQLGWYRTRSLPGTSVRPDTLRPGIMGGEALRVWTRGQDGPEYFLLECRDGAAAYPFDAALPAAQMVIYHIDENLPEGAWSEDEPGRWHLRARLVEADDDGRLARGEDDGRAEDLFPGPLGVDRFGPFTAPASDGYLGPTEVDLGGITPGQGTVFFTASTAGSVDLDFSFGFTGDGPMALDLVVHTTGPDPAGLEGQVAIAGSPAWGAFAGGLTSVDFTLEREAENRWVPAIPIDWLPDPELPDDARTTFTFRFRNLELDTGPVGRTWYWQGNAAVLDFTGQWPGSWVIDHPAGDTATTWHRWDAAPWVSADGTPVLACTGSVHNTSAAWPAVAYGNRAHATLTSGPLGPAVSGVRLVHALETEMLTGATAMDGGVISWVGPDGSVIPAEPVDGWPGAISSQSLNPLHGQGALVRAALELEEGIPLWRTDIIPVPASGEGPWRLRLEFASNTLFRRRGWFVARIEPVFASPEGSAFPIAWEEGLRWAWPGEPGSVRRFTVQGRDDADSTWFELADEIFSATGPGGDYFLAADRILPLLDGPRRQRHVLRVIGFDAVGPLATRELVLFPDGGDGHAVSLTMPWPNPSSGSVRMLLDIPVAEPGQLTIVDLRGRLLMSRVFPPGSHLFVWDGHDADGRRAASGTYFIRLEGSGPVTTRKVVLLH
jgi:M6 family metalloprotease-like protein